MTCVVSCGTGLSGPILKLIIFLRKILKGVR